MEFTCNLRLKKMSNYVALQPVYSEDIQLFEKLLSGDKPFYTGTFATPINERTYKQVKTVWKLVRCIWDSQNTDPGTGRVVPPSKDELYELYLDLLEEYGEKRESKLTPGRLIPVHISTADTKAGAVFIEGLMIHLANYCQLSMQAQTQVRDLLFIWEQWRGSLTTDPLDYHCTEAQWYERHTISQASFRAGVIQKCHIVSRGADIRDIDEPWNWIALLEEEHIQIQHQKGWEAFLNEFPHLRGRVERARNFAKKIEKIQKAEGSWRNEE